MKYVSFQKVQLLILDWLSVVTCMVVEGQIYFKCVSCIFYISAITGIYISYRADNCLCAYYIM
jgi:hypothetical protein